MGFEIFVSISDVASRSQNRPNRRVDASKISVHTLKDREAVHTALRQVPMGSKGSDEVSTSFNFKHWVTVHPSCYLSASVGYFDAWPVAAHQGLSAKHGTCGKRLLVYTEDNPVAGKHADGAPNRCCRNYPGHGTEFPRSKDCKSLLLHLLNGSSAPSEYFVDHLGTLKIQRSRKAPCNQPQRSAQDMQSQHPEAPSEGVCLQTSKPRQCQNRARKSTPRPECLP